MTTTALYDTAGTRVAVDSRRACLTVREGEPSAQMLSSLTGGSAIERHERRRAAGCPGDLGPPLVGTNTRDLYEVLATVDNLFEAMNVHVDAPRIQTGG
jgi:hypothetical protein